MTKHENNWISGRIGIPDADGSYTYFEYWVKVYETGSEFGIDGGKIGKLTIKKDGMPVVNYDRGWDLTPSNDAEKQALASLIKDMN